MSRYTANQIENSKSRILDSASTLFREKGYAGSGIKEIMTIAGLTNGTFYAHFKSKAHLFSEVIKNGTKIRSKGLEEIPAENMNDKVIKFLNFYLSDSHFNNQESGCLMPRLAGDLSEYRHISSKEIDLYLEGFIKIIRKSVKDQGKSNLLASAAVGILTMARTMDNKKGLEFLKSSRQEYLKLYKGITKGST